jgi:hypothetical protein
MSKRNHDDDNNDNETTTKLQSTGVDLPNKTDATIVCCCWYDLSEIRGEAKC